MCLILIDFSLLKLIQAYIIGPIVSLFLNFFFVGNYGTSLGQTHFHAKLKTRLMNTKNLFPLAKMK